jgi:predicted metal-dependent hydrolase
MKKTLLYLLLALIVIILYVAHQKINHVEVVYIKSQLDGEEYLVRNLPDKKKACNILSTVKKNIKLLKTYLYKNKEKYPDYIPYIEQLYHRSEKVIISESNHNSKYTSYTVDKGEEMVLCLRSKKNHKLHELNLIMYVVIHEMAHIACPELDHTPLFKKIFIFLLERAVELGIYKYINYEINPHEYCGITVYENLLRK